MKDDSRVQYTAGITLGLIKEMVSNLDLNPEQVLERQTEAASVT